MRLVEERTENIVIVEDEGLIAADVQRKLQRLGYHQMERRVRATESWLSATLHSVGDGILGIDPAGEIVFMNRVAEDLTGWCSADANGQLLMEILVLSEEASGLAAKNPVFDLIPGVPGERRCYLLTPKNGGETAVEVQCFENRPAHDSSDLLGTIVVLRDCTARRQTEGRLAQSQSMEAVANIASGLAHEFNNQLTVILGYADELCAQTAGESNEAALEIRHAASVAASIASQILVLSRRNEARLEVLNVNDIVGEMQPSISHALGANWALETDLGFPAGLVRFDRNQFEQVLVNLALYSRDDMRAGGSLRIETSTTEIDPESRQARHYHPGKYVRLRVSDTGSGKEKATRRIFEPLSKAKTVGFDTAPRLSLVQRMIVERGGYIGARSEPGHGTTFDVLLPYAGGVWRISEITRAKRSTSEHALVRLADDDESVRQA